jgi:hypothetical protein
VLGEGVGQLLGPFAVPVIEVLKLAASAIAVAAIVVSSEAPRITSVPESGTNRTVRVSGRNEMGQNPHYRLLDTGRRCHST